MKKYLLTLLTLASLNYAFADDCATTVEANDQMQFNVKEITVPKSCNNFTINLKHTGSLHKAAMGHNLVISKTEDKMAVSADGISAGLDNQYVKKDDVRVLAMTDIIGGGEETKVTFTTDKLTAGEDYSFYCSFPGHVAIMNGKVIVK